MGRPNISDTRIEEILEAFEHCVIQKGFDKTTLGDIAEKSGMPRSLIRYFIGNRADLESKLVDRVLDRVEKKYTAIPACPVKPSPALLVSFVISEVFDDQMLNQLVRELWRLGMRSESLHSRITNMYQRVLNDLNQQFASSTESSDASLTEAEVFGIFSLGLGMTVMAEFGLHPKSKTEFALKALGQISTQSTTQK